ncbi:hypothetical protein TEA_003290 [Camellia sinensis var. sinensis]|uniref:Uncharacterized protein n=1 Tax=Camellia sinensis var. sinensis TaxID=542762 RepID=A0A4S4D4A6_CAMSN|nr:hypothetical protein TEA_003290 [Camellia sinensis var. sinensis]
MYLAYSVRVPLYRYVYPHLLALSSKVHCKSAAEAMEKSCAGDVYEGRNSREATMGSDKAMKQSPSNTPLEASDSSPKSLDEGSSRGNSKPLPFEFRAFEICLESVCRGLESKTSTLEEKAYPALDELSAKTSTHNLKHVSVIKGRLVALSGHVQKVRDEFEHLLDDDLDMAQMYLTNRLATLQSEVLYLMSFEGNQSENRNSAAKCGDVEFYHCDLGYIDSVSVEEIGGVRARHNGQNYVFALLTGYHDPPAGVSIREGLHYNPYFPGGAIAMPKMLIDGAVEYEDVSPATESQMGFKWIFVLSLALLQAAYYRRMRWSVLKSRKLVLDVVN